MSEPEEVVVAAKRPRLENDPEASPQQPMSSGAAQKPDNDAFCAVFSERRVKEVDVGITEFISQHEGFHGIIKQRFSDFLVNEINLEGDRVTLSDISFPQWDTFQDEEGSSETNADLFSESKLEELKLLASGTASTKEVTVEAGDDKAKRRKMHSEIRRLFPGLDSRTEEKNGVKVFVAFRKTKDTGKKGRSSRRIPWAAPGKDYCHFVLYKENKGTMDAANVLSKYLGVNPNMLRYAGTKDKRAKTCQAMSVYRRTASRLHSLNRALRGMALGNFRYCKKPLTLGDLKGNHFVVILRSVSGSDSQIEQAITSLRQIGYINYNGMQRFGTSSVPTHLVGRALIKRQWQEAIELILKPRHRESDEASAARESWWEDRDAAAALLLLGRMQCPERHLLKGLTIKHSNDQVSALSFIPRNTRLLYVHAYQSYLWNLLVSRRVRECGLEPVVGDLVIPGADSLVQDECSEEDTADTVPERSFIEPIIVTEDNISRYTIQEVVMPLPGYDITLPQNEVGEWYREILAQDGLTMGDLKHKHKDYALRGTYRRILIKPTDLLHEVLTYEDPLVSLVLSDYEKLKGESLPHTGGSMRALKLEFTLPSSCYATMAIREILKHDTSAAEQTLLNAKTPTDTQTDTSAAKQTLLHDKTSTDTKTDRG